MVFPNRILQILLVLVHRGKQRDRHSRLKYHHFSRMLSRLENILDNTATGSHYHDYSSSQFLVPRYFCELKKNLG